MILDGSSESQLSVGHVIMRLSKRYSTVSSIARISGYCVLCFHVSLCLQNTHMSPASGGTKIKAITLELKLKIIA